MKAKISKKRFFPNTLTILNMFLGFSSIILIMNGSFIEAGFFILLAGLMDIFDGKIARLLGISSKFGVEFDSLADVVSFCVAPSILVYNLYCNELNSIIGAIFSFIPLIAGTVRLAKYNLESDEDNPKSYFIGLSTPILIGGLMAHFILSENKSKAEPDSILQRGILLSSGLIAGESLMGILLAFIAGAGIQNLDLNLDSSLVSALTFVIALITIYWVYVQSKPKTV